MDNKILAEQFEASRSRLRGVAYRMLGSLTEADDAVQEAWLRLSRSDASGVENMGGWLTTVIARICLDMLRARNARREEALEPESAERPTIRDERVDPEQEALMADSVGLALLVVLQTLAPAERIAFVLHDMFDLPFEEIAPVVGRSPTAARQLASRARRRVQGADQVTDANRAEQHAIVSAFLSASRDGNFEALLAAFDPDVVVRADAAAVRLGGRSEIRGAAAAAKAFAGRAQAARAALVNGAVGAVVAPGGRLLLILDFTIAHGRIVEIEAFADPDRLRELDLAVLEES
jgi:RNA polymerase sigma-70 factor (ECF subfamily)